MILIKRNRIFHARMKSADGRTVSVSTKQTSRAGALAAVKEAGLDKVEAAAATHRLTAEGVTRILAGKRITIEKAIEAWGTSMADIGLAPRTIANSFEVVNRWVNENSLLHASPFAATSQHVNDWINNPKSESKASTRRIAISIIGKFLEFCTHKGWNMGNQAKLVRVNMNLLSHEQKETTERHPFTKSEVSKLLRDLDGFWKFAVRIGWETGLRLGDICQLEWSCFDRPNEVIVWTDKRNKRVAVPISEELSALLTTIPMQDAKYIFPEQRATLLDSSRRAVLSVYFKRYCERAGIEGKSFHSLRHAFVQTHREHGETWEQIAQAIGHSLVETTKGYATKKVGGRK